MVYINKAYMESRSNQSKNHILRAIKATNQPFIFSESANGDSQKPKEKINEFGKKYPENAKEGSKKDSEYRRVNEKDQFLRMYSMFSKNRRNFGMRNEVNRQEYEEKLKEENEREALLLRDVEKHRTNIYNEMFFTPIKKSAEEGEFEFDVAGWMKKRKYLKSDRVQTKDQIDFAKKLFYSWDDDGSGILELDEIAEPLIALGLAPDKVFVAQLIKSLDSKFLNQNDEDLSVTLKDFKKIFRTDKYMKDIILKPTKVENNKEMRNKSIPKFSTNHTNNSYKEITPHKIRYSIVEDKISAPQFTRISTQRTKHEKIL